jgi:hypothetical protein
MVIITGRRALFGLAVAAVFAMSLTGSAFAAPQHGISFTKGCSSPTFVGAPYSCSYTVRNNVDEAGDTLTISQITDTVQASGGNVVHSTVLDDAAVVPSLGATCTAPPNRVCTLPFGSRVDVGPYSFYMVQPGDFALAGHVLADNATLVWHDLCDGLAAGPPPGGGNCNANPPNVGGASQTVVQQPPDANINITPATANNPIGANHVLTITVNSINGTIDAGPHTATASIVSGPGSFVGSPSCTYTGGATTASCTVTITSSTAGTTVVSATSNIPVSGVTITRTTGTAANTASGGSGNAAKNWAAAQVVTNVLDASNTDVTGSTTIPPGTVVHDQATVGKTASTPAAVPNPTGTVTFTLFNGTGCSGAPVSTDPNEPMNAGGVATSVTFTTPAGGGPFSYQAHYNGDANYPQADAPCEPFTVSVPSTGPALTPGFWKNHEAATTALLPLTLGNYVVNTFAKARAIFDAMKCSSPIDCLAAHELAAKLDVAGGSNPVINPVLAQADALLIAVNYNGVGNFTPPTAAQKALALQLEVTIDNYTNQ